MLHGRVDAAAVVDERGRGAEARRQVAIDDDERLADAFERRARRLVVVVRQQQEQAVDLTGRQQLDVLAVELGAILRVGQEQRVPALAQRHLGAEDDLGDVDAGDVAHEEADGHRRALAQAAGQQVRGVAELGDGVVHALAGLGADVRMAAEGPRGGGDRDAGAGRDLAQPGTSLRRAAHPAPTRRGAGASARRIAGSVRERGPGCGARAALASTRSAKVCRQPRAALAEARASPPAPARVATAPPPP